MGKLILQLMSGKIAILWYRHGGSLMVKAMLINEIGKKFNFNKVI